MVTWPWSTKNDDQIIEKSISKNKTSKEFTDKETGQLNVYTDNPSDNPTSDFNTYAETISNLVKYSDPHFTVGIYGDWGTGKTTLMKKIRDLLGWIKEEEDSNFKYSKDQKIITIWFNAWRYEREEHFATIALMRTIAYALAKHQEFQSISKSILSGLKIIGTDVLKKVVTDHVMTEQGFDTLMSSINKKTETVNALDKDTIYFDGLNIIKKQLREIRNDREYRIVVFIDDLDRCSPKRALEVLESIKVFLDIEGFVYILGLSIKTVAKLISVDYSESGIKGEDYIKKIIQIPIRIPPWHPNDIEGMIPKMIKNVTTTYEKLLIDHAHIISEWIETNPRELKAFLNNLMVAINVLSLSSPSKKEFREILTLEVLKSRWNDIYVNLVNDQKFRYEFANMSPELFSNVIELKQFKNIQKNEEQYNVLLNSLYEKITSSQLFIEKMIEFPSDLLDILEKEITLDDEKISITNIIANITNWELYRKAISIGSTITEKEIAESYPEESLMKQASNTDKLKIERDETSTDKKRIPKV